MTEIHMELKGCWIGPKGKISTIFKDLSENVEWGFSGSCVFATNPESVQTG